MFLENPSEGFVIESFTSAARYYSLSLKCLLYALWREGESRTPPHTREKNLSMGEACHQGQLGGQLLKFE